MPDSRKYNLKYRPGTYWGINENNTHIGSTIKGEIRRNAAKQLADAGHLDPLISVESLPEDHLTATGRIDPWFMGGEYLPDLKPNEAEIARAVLKSTTMDVISVRARKTKNRIHYRIVDEYEDNPVFDYKVIQKTSLKPLTMKQLIKLIDNAQENGGLSASARHWNFEYLEDAEELYDFATISSEFYPELGHWYDEANEEWLDENTTDRSNI
jgi:hypothetical protein